MADKQHIKGAIDKIKGAFKDALGRSIGNRRLQVEGKLDKTKGAVRSAVGDVRDAVGRKRGL